MSVLCPNCGNKMEEGSLCGKAPILWSEQPLAMFRGGGDVTLFGNELFGNGFPVAHLCRTCRRVFVEY